MMKHTRQLPVRLPPYPDELLSSWINRHATFYAVPPLVMLRHCLPEASAVRAADLHLCNDQEIRLANIFATEPAVVHRMTLTNVAIIASAHLHAANAGLPKLQPGTRGTGVNPAKPAARMAHHMPSVWKPTPGCRRARTPLPFPAISRCGSSWSKPAQR